MNAKKRVARSRVRNGVYVPANVRGNFRVCDAKVFTFHGDDLGSVGAMEHPGDAIGLEACARDDAISRENSTIMRTGDVNTDVI